MYECFMFRDKIFVSTKVKVDLKPCFSYANFEIIIWQQIIQVIRYQAVVWYIQQRWPKLIFKLTDRLFFAICLRLCAQIFLHDPPTLDFRFLYDFFRFSTLSIFGHLWGTPPKKHQIPLLIKTQKKDPRSLHNIADSRNHIIQRKRRYRSCYVLRSILSLVINLPLSLNPLTPTPNATHILHPLKITPVVKLRYSIFYPQLIHAFANGQNELCFSGIPTRMQTVVAELVVYGQGEFQGTVEIQDGDETDVVEIGGMGVDVLSDSQITKKQNFIIKLSGLIFFINKQIIRYYNLYLRTKKRPQQCFLIYQLLKQNKPIKQKRAKQCRFYVLVVNFQICNFFTQ
eukprot:TRINITY_DN871_c0_g1_i1.p1 TRINITY_DN871_c0_g1~~TRINITY_DN871_c0_g1_i1.p1  ORF type:complete len:342 (-),score=4.79 TRINITY_DN871_c0_g1_i1:1284-2309(-)